MTLRDAVLGAWELVSFVARDAAMVDKMARDPSYVPALDPEASALLKRAAAPEPEAKAEPAPAAEPVPKANVLEDRQTGALLPDLLSGSIGGGLREYSSTDHLAHDSILTRYSGRCPSAIHRSPRGP